uniref:Uncharacterized protein n=1 Tax=Panagrolaimus davidi TaxID=227884 RepID=A0A914PR81_9BILA
MTDNYILFQNAPKRVDCDRCQEIIPAEHLEVVYQKFYHFNCFFNVYDVLRDKKITKKKFFRSSMNIFGSHMDEYDEDFEFERPKISLEGIDFIGGFNLRISEADLSKLRKHLVLAKERKTRCFIPSVLKTSDVNCAAEECCFHSRRGSGVGKFGLLFQNNDYHPECLAKTGKVNCYSNEIDGYDSLSERKKKLLDELYKKDNAFYLLPIAETACSIDEKYLCAAPECSKCHSNIGYNIKGLRIRYQTKTYHPECFAAMGKVNKDGEEIGNYHKLSYSQKLRLRKLYKKSNDFDIPLIEKAKRDDYCTLPDCLAANGQPSKFPFPYTVKQDELQIKFHGDIYHSKCFKYCEKSEMDIKKFLGYDSLSQRTKQLLQGIFEDIEMDIEEGESSGDDDSDVDIEEGESSGDDDSDVDIEEGESSGDDDSDVDIEVGESSGDDDSDGIDGSDVESDQMDDDNEGPPAKKSKMEPQMQDENVSNENIQNEFDNDQEPFDGTNVEEEMSEPVILQINTLNELNNTQGRPQTVNHREEREGNQESGNLVVENVVSGNEIEDIKEIPEIKKEIKGEPEIVTLDDDETDAAESEPQNDIRQNGKEVQPTVFQEHIVNTVPQLFQLEAFIKSTLGTLKIPFTRDAYGFLRKIKYTNIPATASPGTTFEILSSTDSFFKCLSLFFTGEEKHNYGIKAKTQLYICNNFKTFGKYH